MVKKIQHCLDTVDTVWMSKTFDLVDFRDLVINTTYLVLYCGLGNRPVSLLESHLKNRKQKCASTKSGQGKELGIMDSRIEDFY